MSEASSGSGSPQSSTGLSNRRSERDPVVTCACASPLKKKKKTLLKEHALISVDLLLPKK